MLPQKKNLLRRNAWYRQQLLQQSPESTPSDTDTRGTQHTCRTSSQNVTVTPTHKSPASTESAIIC
jgi:hypothetical protein